VRDRLDDRVVGAFRFIDAVVKTPITAPLRVEARGVRLIRNRSGLFVIAAAPGLGSTYTATFELPVPPAAPLPPPVASVSVTITVSDPSGRYLPRRATVAVPRNPDPAAVDQPTSLFQPADVELFPSPTAAVATGWATIRVSVKQTGTQTGVPFAYVRVRRASDDGLLARGVADDRGEALVAVPGIPVTLWNTTPGPSVVTNSVAAKLTAHFDPSAFDAASSKYPDPDQLELNLSTLTKSADVPLDLASGREVPKRVDMTLPA
jgi:hypothetical protein